MGQQICVDCKKVSPSTESSQTLVSSRHGWRLARVTRPEGTSLEWRCPDCWAAFVKKRQETGG
jgi:hypothetical protein